ncbi:MAG: hypothetical protein C0459_14385 [Chitinophaga sp.]|jgi:gliding motility-associated-like protein|nr:hypothetical protein [Chitinophaga sp.]
MRFLLTFTSLLILLKSVSAQTNSCGLKAQFTNMHDTIVVADTFRGNFINTSIGATSFKWLLNGYPYYYGTNEPQKFDPFINNFSGVGIYKIQLAVTNGICVDTGSCIIIFTGINPPISKKHFSLGLSVFGTDFRKYQVHTINDFITLGNGDNNIVAGSYMEYFNSNVAIQPTGILININDSGCIKWAKSLTENSAYYKVEKCKNGDLLTACYAQQFGAVQGNVLIRLDPNGNVKWAKSIQNISFIPSNSLFNLIKEDESGNIILTGYTDWNTSYNGFNVFKLDSTGKLLWSKLLERNYSGSYFNFTTCNSITVKDNFIYLCGYTGVDNNSQRIEGLLLKINSSNGNLIWTKTYTNSINNSYIFRDINFQNNNIFIAGNTNSILGSSSIIPNYLYMDTSGHIIKSLQINISDFKISDFYRFKLFPLANGSFYVTLFAKESLELQPGYAYHNIFMKINKSDMISWQYNFSDYYRDYFNKDGIGTDNSLMSVGIGLNSVLNPNGGKNIIFAKIDSLGTINNLCNFYNINYSISNTYLQESNFKWDIDSSTNYFKMLDIIANQKDIAIVKNWLCPSYIDSCSYLEIDGIKKLCDLNSEYTFKIRGNGTCGYQAFYSNNIQVVSQNSNEIKVRFLNYGSHKIKIARNFGCQYLADSITILAKPVDAYFNLGNDTSICPGSRITLRATNKFLSYKWQDGSSDSIFLVSQPGTYYVSVRDSCNNINSDTIVISQVNQKYINIIKDTSICYGDSLKLQAGLGYKSYVWTSNPTVNFKVIDSTKISFQTLQSTTFLVSAVDSFGCTIKDTSHITVFSLPNIKLGNDTTLCEGNNLLLDAGFGFVSYKWNIGSTAQKITVNKTGNYKVIITDNNKCVNTDNINVSFQKIPVFSLGADTTLCEGKTLLVKTDTTGTYLWQDGSNKSSFIISQPGNYWLQINRGSCFYRDTINVWYKPSPQINFPGDTILCDKAKFVLNAKQTEPSTLYLWQDGSTSSTFLVSKDGVYHVQVNINSCLAYDTILVNYQKTPIDLYKDTSKCKGDYLLLDCSTPGAFYLWQDFSNNNSFTAINPGIYKCTITNYCGKANETFNVSDKICECNFNIANIFSPNGDGVNDYFFAGISCQTSFFDIKIFDRGGRIIYQTNNPNFKWDGNLNNKPVPIGIYYYVIKIKGQYDNIIKQKAGSISIIR